jgi:AcrR family transcriptional regulator
VEVVETLRDRKKAATRQSLHEAALRLAMANGLDGVTVEDIADEAGVSRRTFSNYFANKEDAILHADRERTGRLLSLLAARPGEEPAWVALRRAVADLFHGRPEPELAWVEQLRLLRRHPTLLARQATDQIALERELAGVLVERWPGTGEELARLMAATSMAAFRTAGALWLERSGEEPLPVLVDRLLSRIDPR